MLKVQWDLSFFYERYGMNGTFYVLKHHFK